MMHINPRLLRTQGNNNDPATTVNNLIHSTNGLYIHQMRVRKDVETLLNQTSLANGLTALLSEYIDNSGHDYKNLLTLRGTIPINYRGSTYRTPIEIYMPIKYPMQPPLCFVRPVPNMRIKQNHTNVTTNGAVHFQYMDDWRPHSHSLVQCVQNMVNIFSDSPPLYAISNTTTRQQQQQHQDPPSYHQTVINTATTTTTNHHEQQNNRSSSISNNYIEMQRRQEELIRRQKEEDIRNRQLVEEEQQIRRQQREEDEERRRQQQQQIIKATESSLRVELNEKLKNHYEQVREQAEKTRMLALQEVELNNCIHKTLSMKTSLESEIPKLEDQIKFLSEWIEDHDENEKAEINVDDMAVPLDVLSKQMLELNSKDEAYSDCLYRLQQVQNQYADNSSVGMSLQEYMKTVRKLAADQFRTRYLLEKVIKESSTTRPPH